MFKKKVIKIISNSLNEKIKILEKELKQINYEKNNQTKSSAGDKYETSRSSMQIEYDKLNSNLQNLKINLNKINLIDSYKKYKKVAYGALVKTKSSYYLISVGLGKFIIEGKNDDISAPGQCLAALEILKKIPDNLKFSYLHENAGHYGIFSGKAWREDIRPEFINFINKF